MSELRQPPMPDAALGEDLLTSSAELAEDAEAARAASLPPEARAAEVARIKAAILSKAAQMRGELEQAGDPDSLARAQVWYRRRLASIDAALASPELAIRRCRAKRRPQIHTSLRLLWASDKFRTGGGFGYSVHALKMKQALIEAGVAITTDPADAFDLAVHVVPCLENLEVLPEELREFASFKPIPGKRNLLFTQIELTAPQYWPENINTGADLIVTACTHSRDVLSRYFPGPIFVCPEGIDPELFPFYQRKETSKLASAPFRFLWVNNLSDEKGIKILFSAWSQLEMAGRLPYNWELYVKASGVPGGTKYEHPRLHNVIIDQRNLPVAELAKLYQDAHAFVSCSHGEAWGLTLSEAMATGLPCIWTHWSAPLDYADETIGFPVTDFGMVPFASKSRAWSLAAFGARTREEAVVGRMEEIYRNYPEALERGKRASDRMHTKYTWAHAARRFIEICEQAAQIPVAPRSEAAIAS